MAVSQKNNPNATALGTVIEAKSVTADELQKKHNVRLGNPVYGKTAGAKIVFECNGKIRIATYEGQEFASAYALSTNGMQLKLNGGFESANYAAGKRIPCVVVEQEVQGVNRKWLVQE